MVLAIETATTVCATAIVSGETVLAEHSLNQPHVHAEKLLRLIEQAQETAACKAESIQGIAVSIGPGSFTGLRIGLSVAKGLSYAWNVPILAVPTLHALAWNCIQRRIGYNGDYILSALDAKRDEVYAAMYLKHEHTIEEVLPVQAITLKQCVTLLEQNHKTILIGDAVEKFQHYLQQHSSGRTDVFFPGEHERECSAVSVGILGELLLKTGTIADTASLEPAYIKEFVTTAQPQSMVNLHGMV